MRLFYEKEHVFDFVAGKLRVGRIRCYRAMERKSGGDPNEGVSCVISKNDYEVFVGPTDVHPEQWEWKLKLPIESGRIMFDGDLDSYILCMSTIPVRIFENGIASPKGYVERVSRSIRPKKTGAYMVLIKATAFLERLRKCPFMIDEGPVKYDDIVNPEETLMLRRPFVKDKRYRNENEYRLQFKFKISSNEDYRYVGVGDLRQMVSVKYVDFLNEEKSYHL